MALPIELVRRVTRGECILFLGASVHAAPGDGPFHYPEPHRPPSGKELATRLAGKCDFQTRFPEESTQDLQRVSLYIDTSHEFGRRVLVEYLREELGPSRKPSPALKMLAALPFRIIVTTNYDSLLEDALSEQQRRPKCLIYNPNGNEPTRDVDDPTATEPLVFKMHGDLAQPDTIVITDEDYIGFVQRMSDKDAVHPVPATIRYRLQRWPTLFVGYSLKDYNLRLLFRTLRWGLDRARFPTCFSVDISPDPLILEVWQNNKNYIAFVTKDLWTFVPELYEAVLGQKWGQAQAAPSGL